MNPEKSESPKISSRMRNGHVSIACTNCKISHLKCDNGRPCSRCIASNKQDSCRSSTHRKRGRPRMDKSARSQSESEYSTTKSVGVASLKNLLSQSDAASDGLSSEDRLDGSNFPARNSSSPSSITDDFLQSQGNPMINQSNALQPSTLQAKFTPDVTFQQYHASGWEMLIDPGLTIIGINHNHFIGYLSQDIRNTKFLSLIHYADHGFVMQSLNSTYQSLSTEVLNAHLRCPDNTYHLFTLRFNRVKNGFKIEITQFIHPKLITVGGAYQSRKSSFVQSSQNTTTHALN